jgi:protein gp37
MGEVTAISWCDHTHNHWIGCTKVSPACDGCYAEAMMDKRYGRVQWGAPGKGVGTRSLTSEANRRKPLAWNRKAAAAGTRPFVFCSSLADVFDNQVPTEWRTDLFDLIRSTPRLVWLLLTKRPQLIGKLSREAGGLPRNAAIGTTVEDRERALINVAHLRNAKHAVSPLFAFLSCEPLLEGIDLSDDIHDLDWVITGGETDQGGHKARPSSPQWFRDLRDQCAAAGVAYHHKQNGEWVSVSEVEGPGEHFEFPDGRRVRRVGKARSGRTIDGAEHGARPSVRALEDQEG